jgi:hypothetical protein
MGKKPLTPEQRRAKTEREKARRARLKAEKGESSTPKKPKANKTKKGAKGEPELAARSGKEVDVATLKPGETVKMLGAVHKLQKRVETAEAACERAKRDHREARAKLEKARTALKKEIDEQRFGPGELYGPGADTMHVQGAKDEDEDEGERESA